MRQGTHLPAYPLVTSDPYVSIWSCTDPVSYTHLDVYKRQLLCMAAVLCGCAREKNSLVRYREDERPKARITFFGNKYEPENVAVVEEILSGFMRENPDVQVTYESLKGNDYFEALSKRMASGRGDDVMMVNHEMCIRDRRWASIG